MTDKKGDTEDLKNRLEKRRREILSSIEIFNRRRTIYWAVSIIIVTLSSGYAVYKANPLFLVIGCYAFFPIMILYLRPRPSEWELLDVEEQIDLLDYEHVESEQRAERLFKHHQYELKKYYDQTLRHSSGIFFFGLICIAMGFAIIGVTFYLVGFKIQSGNLTDKIVIGSLGALGSILSNYIAAIYLKMFTKTIGSLTMFHNRLVTTHHLHYGSFLASKIQDKTLREKTLSQMSINTSKGTPAVFATEDKTDEKQKSKKKEEED